MNPTYGHESHDEDTSGYATARAATTAHTFISNETPTVVNNRGTRCCQGVRRFLRTVSHFFKTMIAKKKREEGVDVIPVVSFSELGSAGFDKADPQPVVQPPARTSCGNAFCADIPLPLTPIHALGGETGMAGGYACPGDQTKMARVVEWLYQSEDDAGRVAPAADVTSKADSNVQLSEAYCDSSVPCPTSALSDNDEEEELTPFRGSEGYVLVNETEGVLQGRMLSLNRIGKALGFRQRDPREQSSNHRGTRRRGRVFVRMSRLGALAQ